MLKKCDDTYVSRVVEYIGDDKILCFYLYMDLLECGTQGDGVGLWVCEEDGGLQAVMYRYYDCLHIYSRGLCPLEETMSLIREFDPKVITGKQENIDRIAERLEKGRYTYELSHIITADKLMDGKSDLDVQPAGEADVPEIASLMMKEHIYNTVYTYDSLCEALVRRIREGFGRLFVPGFIGIGVIGRVHAREIAVMQEGCEHIGAAGGGIAAEDETEAHAGEQAAVNGSEQHIIGSGGEGQVVDQQGEAEHGEQ